LTSSLSNNQFVILIDNENIPFTVEKKNNRIVLGFSNIRTLKFPDKFGENAEVRFQKFMTNEKSKNNGERIITSLINIFKKKYPKRIERLPLVKNENGEYYNPPSFIYNELKGIRLMDFKFEMENYIIFQDSVKTVFLGFTNLEMSIKISDKYKSLALYDPSPKITIGEHNPFNDAVRNYLKNTSYYQLALNRSKFEEPITKKEGYKLEVNYLFNSDFEILEVQIKENALELKTNLKIKDSLANAKKNSIDQNLDNL
jgi:hypothetical protein